MARLFVYYLWVMYMIEHNYKIVVLSILLIVGLMTEGWYDMDWGWAAAWIAAIALLAFLWLPEIKTIRSKYVSLDKKMNEISDQYDEFQKTVLPILKAVMASVIASPYPEMGPKTDVMLNFFDFINTVNNSITPDSQMTDLTDKLKGSVLQSFRDSLVHIIPESEKFISPGLPHNYLDIKNNQIRRVDINGLKSLRDKMSPSDERQNYTKLIKQLEQFSKQYL